MMIYARILLLGLISAHTMACEGKNSGYCSPTDEDPACLLDGPACKSDPDCVGEPMRNVCDVGGSDTCVQCTPTNKSACTVNEPVCGANLECRGCEAHSECPSDACVFGGACVPETEVIYVKEGGTGVAPCSKADPCGSLTIAYGQLMGNRRNIRVVGSHNTEAAVALRTVSFFGDEGTSILKGLPSGGGAGPIFDVSMNSTLNLYGMTLADSRTEGIRISETSQLLMVRSKIVNATREGLTLDGKATLRQSEVSSCNDPARRGIRVDDDGELTMDRSVVAENEGGGIQVVDGGQFSITNSFIVGNKSNGGFSSLLPQSGSKLEFNTIVDNISGTGTAAAGGVFCDSPTSFVRSNIIYRNAGGPGGMVQRAGQCVGTNFEMFAAAADDTLKFAAAKDYHLTSASPASVMDAGGATCPAVDYDGDPRPQGAACELGADEIKP